MAQQQRYKVLDKIAAGGMAEVFRAESAGLEGFKKTVAIKRVLPHLSEKKQFMGMFLDEARLSARLTHSNCVQVFDIGVGDNTYFIVMEYVDGTDLKGIIEHRRKINQPFPVEEACLICVRICEGLSYAHELKDGKGTPLHIVHRDMSPPNVLITRHGEVKIVDFGLAKANSQLEKSEPGIIKGKFSYLSPEAALGKPVDAKTDIFAVGIILWEMLAGRRLFFGETDLETVRQVQRAQIPPIRQLNPRVTPDLEKVLARSLAQNPDDRYATARDLGRDLNDVLFHAGRPVSSFDIAALVDPVISERKTRKEGRAGSVIGSLIEQALFEFTSIDQERRKGDSVVALGSSPIALGGFGGTDFGETTDWSKNLSDLSLDSGSSASSPLEGDSFDLSTLEEDGPKAKTTASTPSSQHQMPAIAPQPVAPAPSGSRFGIVAVVIVLLMVAGVAGAYFGNLLPLGQ